MADALVDAYSKGSWGDLQNLISQQGLTAEQAMSKYGVDQGLIDSLGQQGISFSSGAPAAAPTASPAAQSYVPTGGNMPGSTEYDFNQYQDATNNYWKPYAENVAGMSWEDFQNGGGEQYGYKPGVRGYQGPDATAFTSTVTGNTVNPNTGAWAGNTATPSDSWYSPTQIDRSAYPAGGRAPAPAPAAAGGLMDATSPSPSATTTGPAPAAASTISDQQVNDWFTSNPGATDQQIHDAMVKFNVPNDQISRVTGTPLSDVQTRFNAVGGSAPPPAPPPGGGYTPSPPAAPAPGTGGTTLPGGGLMDSVNVPPANKATVGDIGTTTAASAPNVTAPSATASTYDATKADPTLRGPATNADAASWNPDAQSTVQGQIKDIIAEGSPLMDMAETRAKQKANRSGLMNSSMAVGAGQAALYDAALPIAQQDASTFATSGQFNAGNKQQTNMANAAAANEVDSTNAQIGTQVSLANAAASNTAKQFAAQTATDVSKYSADNLLKAGVVNQDQANAMARFNASEQNKTTQVELATDAQIQQFNASESNSLLKLGMDSQTKMALAQVEATYKTLMQTSASSAEVYKTLVGQMGSIMANPDMDAAAKTAAVGNLVSVLNASLEVIGSISNMNLPELDFSSLSPVPGAPTSAPAGAPAAGGGGSGSGDPAGNGGGVAGGNDGGGGGSGGGVGGSGGGGGISAGISA